MATNLEYFSAFGTLPDIVQSALLDLPSEELAKIIDSPWGIQRFSDRIMSETPREAAVRRFKSFDIDAASRSFADPGPNGVREALHDLVLRTPAEWFDLPDFEQREAQPPAFSIDEWQALSEKQRVVEENHIVISALASRGEKYFNMVRDIASELPKMHHESRLAIVIPAYNEDQTIERTLQSLVDQRNLDGSPVDFDKWEALIVLNFGWSETDNAKNLENLIRLYQTIVIIDDFKVKCPRANINYTVKIVSEDILYVGLARMIGHDIVMMRSASRPVAHRVGELFMRTGDADAHGLNPYTLAEIFKKIESGEPVEIIRERGDYPKDQLYNYPLLNVLHMLWEGTLGKMAKRTENAWTVGRGFTMQTYAYATVGGFVGKRIGPAVDEDIRLALEWLAARKNDHRGIHELPITTFVTDARREIATVTALREDIRAHLTLEYYNLATLFTAYAEFSTIANRTELQVNHVDGETAKHYETHIPPRVVEQMLNSYWYWAFTEYSLWILKDRLPQVQALYARFARREQQYMLMRADYISLARDIWEKRWDKEVQPIYAAMQEGRIEAARLATEDMMDIARLNGIEVRAAAWPDVAVPPSSDRTARLPEPLQVVSCQAYYEGLMQRFPQSAIDTEDGKTAFRESAYGRTDRTPDRKQKNRQKRQRQFELGYFAGEYRDFVNYMFAKLLREGQHTYSAQAAQKCLNLLVPVIGGEVFEADYLTIGKLYYVDQGAYPCPAEHVTGFYIEIGEKHRKVLPSKSFIELRFTRSGGIHIVDHREGLRSKHTYHDKYDYSLREACEKVSDTLEDDRSERGYIRSRDSANRRRIRYIINHLDDGEGTYGAAVAQRFLDNIVALIGGEIFEASSLTIREMYGWDDDRYSAGPPFLGYRYIVYGGKSRRFGKRPSLEVKITKKHGIQTIDKRHNPIGVRVTHDRDAYQFMAALEDLTVAKLVEQGRWGMEHALSLIKGMNVDQDWHHGSPTRVVTEFAELRDMLDEADSVLKQHVIPILIPGGKARLKKEGRSAPGYGDYYYLDPAQYGDEDGQNKARQRQLRLNYHELQEFHRVAGIIQELEAFCASPYSYKESEAYFINSLDERLAAFGELFPLLDLEQVAILCIEREIELHILGSERWRRKITTEQLEERRIYIRALISNTASKYIKSQEVLDRLQAHTDDAFGLLVLQNASQASASPAAQRGTLQRVAGFVLKNLIKS